MNVKHREDIPVTTTIEEKGVVFVNFPAYQCACGKSKTFMLGDLSVAEMIADTLTQTTAVNLGALTVDYSKIEPEILSGYEARVTARNQTIIDEARQLHQTDRPIEEVEQEIMSAIWPDGVPDDSIDCSELLNN